MLKRLLLTLVLLLIATLAFGQDFKVSDIQIEGNNRIETSTILAAIPISPGDQVTLEKVDQAMHNVFSLGWFDDIATELTEVQGAKVLTFVVVELPLIRNIVYSGNDELSEETLRKKVLLRIPEIYNHNKVNVSLQQLKTAYAEEGYHAADIKAELQTDAQNEATVTFVIKEGTKVLIDEIRFVGNKSIDADELKDAMQTQERWWLSWITGRGAYQPEVMELDVERIKAAYKDKGYMDIKVQPPVVSLIKNDKYLDVMIEIDEGSQYRVGDINIKGDLLQPPEVLLALVSLKTGDVYNQSMVFDSVGNITDLYANQGYANANVAPLRTKKPADLTIDLMLDVEQGIKIFIEKVKIRGNTKSRDKVVRRQIPIIEGEQYSADKIKETNRNIRNLGFFEEVNVSTSPGSDESKRVLDIDVTERPTGTFSVGVGYSSVDQFISQGSITQDNFLGYGVKLRLNGSLSSSNVTYSLGITDPYFLDTEWSVGFEVYKSEREYDDYDEYRTGGAISAGHPISKFTKGYLTYRYEDKEILNLQGVTSQLIKDQEGTSTLSSITGQLVRNSTDYHLDPTTGGISKFTLEYAGLGGTEKFAKGTIEHRHFFPLFWSTVFSIHGEVGHVIPTSDDEIPIGERFYLGGIKNIRGFETREVGPKEGDDFIGGEKMAYFNLEYIFPVAKSLGLKGVIFYDAGNAWTDQEDYFRDMRQSVGAGIRWQSPLGPLRFEWGYNLVPKKDEKQSVFEFTIGTAF